MEAQLLAALDFLTTWLHENLLTIPTALQWACGFAAYAFALLLWKGPQKFLFGRIDSQVKIALGRSVLKTLVASLSLVIFIVLLQLSKAGFIAMDIQPRQLEAASELAVAWILIRFLTSLIRNDALARGMAATISAIAGLHIFGLLAPVTTFLDKLSFSTGEVSFTALGALKGVALALIYFQVASLTAHFAEHHITRVQELSVSFKVLLIKVAKVLLYTVAILFAMSSVGIDLTSLAIFSSALGIGIGFGLKTIISNYIAGVLLLMDNSIKPGDTIEVGTVFGVVREMRSRYASVLTRSGKEHLIPNEMLITDRVVNWTFSDSNIRMKIPVGISYESDVQKALQLLNEASQGVHRVLKNPAPSPRFMGFGESSLDLELRVWIADAELGMANVRSEVLLNIWTLFNENGIEFPFPQRDIMLKPQSALHVTLEKGKTVPPASATLSPKQPSPNDSEQIDEK